LGKSPVANRPAPITPIVSRAEGGCKKMRNLKRKRANLQLNCRLAFRAPWFDTCGCAPPLIEVWWGVTALTAGAE
jgi:hypothetical protein